MKIVLATPLYPPDIAEPAPYVKELAKRLSGKHEITVVTYGRLPERVPGVRIVAVNKQNPLPFRILIYAGALFRAALGTDVIYIQNGPSVELPAGIVALLTRKPLIARIGDIAAHEHASKSVFRSQIEHFTFSRAKKIITDSPIQKVEILPLEPRPVHAIEEYDKSWETHLKKLEDTLKHV